MQLTLLTTCYAVGGANIYHAALRADTANYVLAGRMGDQETASNTEHLITTADHDGSCDQGTEHHVTVDALSQQAIVPNTHCPQFWLSFAESMHFLSCSSQQQSVCQGPTCATHSSCSVYCAQHGVCTLWHWPLPQSWPWGHCCGRLHSWRSPREGPVWGERRWGEGCIDGQGTRR